MHALPVEQTNMSYNTTRDTSSPSASSRSAAKVAVRTSLKDNGIAPLELPVDRFAYICMVLLGIAFTSPWSAYITPADVGSLAHSFRARRTIAARRRQRGNAFRRSVVQSCIRTLSTRARRPLVGNATLLRNTAQRQQQQHSHTLIVTDAVLTKQKHTTQHKTQNSTFDTCTQALA
jgi:hypothetical protein